MPEPLMNAADLRRRLHGSDPSLAVAEAEVDQIATEHPEVLRPSKPGRSSTLIPRPKLGSGEIPRPKVGSGLIPRPGDVSTRTPLPSEIPLPSSFASDELTRLARENAELRNLIDQAIAQEEENEKRVQSWLDRESEYVRRINSLEEQVHKLKTMNGDAGDLVVRLHEREQAANILAEQVQQLETHLAYFQENGGANIDAYLAAIRERDQLLEELTTRAADLEQQLASIPPPPPTDEELSKMADELERERVQITRLSKELEEQRRQHKEEEEEFEQQMREMEVQMSKERADIARQRMELNRMQVELRADFEAAQRGDPIRDRINGLQQRGGSQPAANPGNGSPAASAPPADSRQARDNNFMNRLFGKR